MTFQNINKDTATKAILTLVCRRALMTLRLSLRVDGYNHGNIAKWLIVVAFYSRN